MSTSPSTVKSMFTPSDRLLNVKPYPMAMLLAARDEQIRKGVDVIDLGVGNPDMRPPKQAIDALKAALDDPAVQNHRYPSFNGLPDYRRAVAQWYQRRFGVTADPDQEILALIGSKEGIVKFLLAHLDPGDTILVTSPCYPAYIGAAEIAQARVVEVPLLAAHEFRPDLTSISAEDARRARLIVVNFPGNPTGGVETPEFYNDLLRFAREYDLVVISDIAYCDISLDPSYRTRSFLEFDRDKERTVEFHSLSKSYSMQGWRVGMAVGNAKAVGNLAKMKQNMDFGVFTAIQRAAAAMLSGPQDYCAEVSAVYRGRRDAFLEAIRPLGYRVTPPKAGMYVWMPIPRTYTVATEFVRDLLEKTGVVVSAGTSFGKAGEGYVRVALCDGEARLREAGERMVQAGMKY